MRTQGREELIWDLVMIGDRGGIRRDGREASVGERESIEEDEVGGMS